VGRGEQKGARSAEEGQKEGWAILGRKSMMNVPKRIEEGKRKNPPSWRAKVRLQLF